MQSSGGVRFLVMSKPEANTIFFLDVYEQNKIIDPERDAVPVDCYDRRRMGGADVRRYPRGRDFSCTVILHRFHACHGNGDGRTIPCGESQIFVFLEHLFAFFLSNRFFLAFAGAFLLLFPLSHAIGRFLKY